MTKNIAKTQKDSGPKLHGKNLIIRINGFDMSKAFLNKGMAFHIKLNKLTKLQTA